MIDFEKLFDEVLEGAPMEEESREDRLKRDDRMLFENSRLHEVKATMSQATTGSRSMGARTHRGTRETAGGKEDIGLIFEGQRLDDLKQGALMADMEDERRARSARGDYSDPERQVDFVGSWKVRNWRDKDGRPRKGFDLQVAAWSFTNERGKKVMEGALPSVPTASKEDERNAAVRARAEDLGQPGAKKAKRDFGEIDF